MFKMICKVAGSVVLAGLIVLLLAMMAVFLKMVFMFILLGMVTCALAGVVYYVMFE